jgi:hypothetical protein
MGRVVPTLVCPLHCHPLLAIPLEAKLILVTIFPTIATMKLYGLSIGWGYSLGFSLLGFSTGFSSPGFSTGSCDNPPRKIPYYRLRPIHFGH